MNITPILNAVIALAAAIVSAFIIPWVKKKAKACDLEALESWTRIAVSAAEQLYTCTQGVEKKAYVLKYLSAKGYNINTEDIENAVEAAVIKLHYELYGKKEA